jgi:hypothetical protein
LVNFSSCRKCGQDPVSQTWIFDIFRQKGGHFVGEETPINSEIRGAFDFGAATDDEFLLVSAVDEEVSDFLGMAINIAL